MVEVMATTSSPVQRHRSLATGDLSRRSAGGRGFPRLRMARRGGLRHTLQMAECTDPRERVAADVRWSPAPGWTSTPTSPSRRLPAAGGPYVTACLATVDPSAELLTGHPQVRRPPGARRPRPRGCGPHRVRLHREHRVERDVAGQHPRRGGARRVRRRHRALEPGSHLHEAALRLQRRDAGHLPRLRLPGVGRCGAVPRPDDRALRAGRDRLRRVAVGGLRLGVRTGLLARMATIAPPPPSPGPP